MTPKQEEILKRQLKRLLISEAVDEAFEALTKGDPKWLTSFKEELAKKSGNTACLSIDFAKYYAVKAGTLTQKPDDHFGNCGWFLED